MSANNTDLAQELATEAGWRPDPTGRYEWRYWDGGWTNRVASSNPESTSREPAPAAPAPAPVAPVTPVNASSMPLAPAAAAVAAALPTARPIEPLQTPGWNPTPPDADRSAAAPRTGRSLPVRVLLSIKAFFTSFVTEQESYHSKRSIEIEPDPRGGHMLAPSPANYGRAGLVALSACGVAIGSYLPWMSGTLDGVSFRVTGFENGHGWSFTIGALALVLASLLAVRWRVLRWVAIALALVLCGLTFRELVNIHERVMNLNASAVNQVDVGTGLWIMAGCAVVAMVASFRLGERE